MSDGVPRRIAALQRLSKRPVRPAAGERRRIAGGSVAVGSDAAHRCARSQHRHAVSPPDIGCCAQYRLLRAAVEFEAAPLAGRYLVLSLPPPLVCPLPRHRGRAAICRNRLCDAAARHLAFTDGGHDRPQPCSRRAQLSIYRGHGAPLAPPPPRCPPPPARRLGKPPLLAIGLVRMRLTRG